MTQDEAAGEAAERKSSIGQALARILASRNFEKSERARDLLKFVVEEELAGRGDRLKAFTIAVDVFGKDASFDAGTDPLVRVHAGRVRELLDQYYEEEGAGETLRITIPKGGYVPQYEMVAPNPAAIRTEVKQGTAAGLIADHAKAAGEEGIRDALREALGSNAKGIAAQGNAFSRPTGEVENPESNKDQARRTEMVPVAPLILRHLKLYWLAIATIIAMLAYVVYALLGDTGGLQTATDASDGPSRGHRGAITTDLLPSVGIIADDGDPGTVLVAGELRTAMPKFDTVRMIAGEGSGSSIDYDFRVSSLSGNKVNVRLVKASSGEVLLSSDIDSSQPSMIDAQVARIGTMALTDGGTIFADIAEADGGNALTRCIILNHEYFRDQTDALHREAWDCFDGIAKRGVKSPLVFSELASLMVESVADNRGYPLDASMARAQRYAEQALSRGPQSAHAHRAMGYVLARQGVEEQALRWAKSAYELNTYNLDLAASYGYALVFAGRYAEGSKLLKRAVDTAGQFQSWWVYGLSCGLLMEKRPQEAWAYAELVRSRSSSHYLALRLVLASQTGNARDAAQLLEELNQRSTSFSKSPKAFYDKARYPSDLASTLIDGLAKAGFVANDSAQ
ncbi:MAG: hypothetical protein R3D32_15265 [Nitratireductor sp.]